MANTQDAQNKDKIEDLEKEAAVELQRQMRNSRQQPSDIQEKNETDEGFTNQDKTPSWLRQEPVTAEGGMARADTGDIRPKEKKEEKPAPGEDMQKQQEQRGKELDRQKRREKREQQRKQKAQKKAEEVLLGKQAAGKEVGKMSPLAFIIWFCLSVIADLCSLIPYVGVLVSWPFAGAFAAYKWKIKIKRDLAIATTALDFILEGFLSTLPVNIVDVILTFILSNSKTVRAVTQKVSSTVPIPKK